MCGTSAWILSLLHRLDIEKGLEGFLTFTLFLLPLGLFKNNHHDWMLNGSRKGIFFLKLTLLCGVPQYDASLSCALCFDKNEAGADANKHIGNCLKITGEKMLIVYETAIHERRVSSQEPKDGISIGLSCFYRNTAHLHGMSELYLLITTSIMPELGQWTVAFLPKCQIAPPQAFRSLAIVPPHFLRWSRNPAPLLSDSQQEEQGMILRNPRQPRQYLSRSPIGIALPRKDWSNRATRTHAAPCWSVLVV